MGTTIAKIITFDAGFYTIEDIISKIKRDKDTLYIESIKVKKDGRVEMKMLSNRIGQEVRSLEISRIFS